MPEETPKAVPSLCELAKDYLKEEQKQRRTEIENLIARIESDQRNGLIFTGQSGRGWLLTPINWAVTLLRKLSFCQQLSWCSYSTVILADTKNS
jgi:hypothetical protein